MIKMKINMKNLNFILLNINLKMFAARNMHPLKKLAEVLKGFLFFFQLI